MDILSYDNSNYSGGSRGGPPPPPLFLDATEASPPPPPPLCQGLDPALNYTSSTALSYCTVVQGGLN